MSNSTPLAQEIFSVHTFETLCNLWRQTAASIGVNARTICELDLGWSSGDGDRFCYLQSPHFNAIVICKIVVPGTLYSAQIKTLFTPAEITNFIQSIVTQISPEIELTIPQIENDWQLQADFTGRMSAILATDRANQREIKLHRQLSEANILNEIATQIHRAIDLADIFQTAVNRVQNLLKTDRAIVYKFRFRPDPNNQRSFENYIQTGEVVYESLVTSDISSVLNFSESDDCFDRPERWQEYESGRSKWVDDVEIEYQDSPCLIDMMRLQAVKSKAIIPIVINGQLWGLVIIHQCRERRNWLAQELEFLERVAEHLGFAIYQSELFANSQRQTKDLEQIVADRTQELRDATIVAQSANQSKTEFLALLSHELRTPLTSILGLSATLLRLPGLNLTERQHIYLQTIHNSGEHLSELVDDILDFYKLEIGKTILKVSEFSLPKLLKQIVDIARTKSELKGIDLQLHIINNGDDITDLGGRDLRFRGDTKRIRQILFNLLTNAFKFTPNGGTTILRAWMEEDSAVFEVEDTGIGIEPEQIPRLFKKFYQLDSTYGRDYAGMGLGLAITQQLVELHGGQIDVESVVGSGSTFTVRLASQPLLSATQPDRVERMAREFEAQDNDNRKFIPKRVVLLERDENTANFISDILTAARYQVTWLVSTDSAVRQIALFQPDLIAIDLTIGEEVVERILRSMSNSITIYEPKIIALVSPDDAIKSSIAEKIDEYIYQPIVPEQLLKKVARLLN
jgi:two-component system, sensor histidine kinase and response regulator